MKLTAVHSVLGWHNLKATVEVLCQIRECLITYSPFLCDKRYINNLDTLQG